MDFNFNFNFNFSFWTVTTVTLLGLFIYYMKNPEKFEKLIALISKYLKIIFKKFDYSYIKFDLQGKINDYLKKVSKKVKHIDIRKINIKWIRPEDQEIKDYIENGELIIRLKKGENQNENIVIASMAFISCAFLKKAKSYVSKSQRESIDLYACYDLLKEEKSEILDQFVQDFMKEKMDDIKIAEYFEKYHEVDKVGLFYPVFIQELTFLGEKVFAIKRDSQKIYEEVTSLTNYLFKYSQRKLNEETISDFNGHYCKFALRIIGKKFKIDNLGKKTYTNNLERLPKDFETVYLIGSTGNKEFIGEVFNTCANRCNLLKMTDEHYKAKIKDRNGNEFEVDAYMLIARSNKVVVYHQ